MGFAEQPLLTYANVINLKWKYFALFKRYQPNEESMIVACAERCDEAKGYRHTFTEKDSQGHYTWGILDSNGEILYLHNDTWWVDGPGTIMLYTNPIKVEVIGG